MSQSSEDSLVLDKERAMTPKAAPSQEAAHHSEGDGRHKTRLLVSVAVLLVTACILPQLLYFLLKDTAHTKPTIAIAVPSALFGASSLFAFGQRSWSLGRHNSTTRPIGGSRLGFDFFHWNFAFGFLYVTGVISSATASQPALVKVAALPLTLLLVQVCSQLVIVQVLAATKLSYFCRVSSMARGTSPIRPALYTIVEDVVAVDGNQGTAWRIAFDERYETNASLRSLLANLSWFWGLSGLGVASMNIVLIFVLPNEDVSWIIGWAVPWVWTAIMATATYFWTEKTL